MWRNRAGTSASYLTGGFGAWNAKNLPLRRKRAEEGEGPSQWVTRERPKIDRIACPWLIRRFIDPTATFIYVAADRVLASAAMILSISASMTGSEMPAIFCEPLIAAACEEK